MLFKNKLLFAILLIGGFLRFFNIANSPPSLNWDEAALGYNAYSILHTAKDEYGVTLPLITRSFDDYKSMLPAYAMVISVAVFGLNETSVRLPSAFFSTLSILLIYHLAKKLLKSPEAALLASFFFAIEPWALHLGRVYHEATFALFFYLASIYLFLESRKKDKLLLLALACGIVSLFSYHTNKVLVPTTFLLFAFLYRKQLGIYSKKIRLASLVLVASGGLIFIHQIVFANALARAESASILRAAKLFDVPVQVILRYLSYFLPANLFALVPKEPASEVPGNSMFFPYEIIFWFVGLVSIFSKLKKHKTLLGLIVVSPIAASLTWNWFEPARVLSLFSFYSMLIGLGAWLIWTKSSSFYRVIYVAFFVPLSIMSIFYIFDSINYKVAARVYGNWQPGFRESMPTVYSKSFDYKEVVIDTPHAQPYIFALFYSKYPPKKYLNELDLQKIGNPRKVYDFGKFVFRSVDFSKNKKNPDYLYVLWKESPGFGQFSDGELAYVKEVKNVDGDTIVQIVSFKNSNEK